ncbi:MAG: hypothetical protein GAK29_03198 [Acinetobacter bereziniae]|uniref:Uncharacterized protein n=1 Tax=Acinetobacter bereziniae TaxID=106648 RepID=A0A833PAX2_ACIBZ|nr:MAG: hypothetical protein GAK29_03198 [Acinetobacter bereziniae]
MLLTKLNNTIYNLFLEKYTDGHIPAESSFRKNYVGLHNVMGEVKEKIENNYVWFYVDETTDSCGPHSSFNYKNIE